jgi:O-antigen/teichoic acid export membrane protein
MKSIATSFGALFRNTFILTISDGINLIGNALFSIVLGRLYGAESLGEYSLILSICLISQTLIDAGYDIELTRKARISDTVEELVLCSFIVKSFLFLLCFVVVISTAQFTTIVTNKQALIIYFIDILPTVLGYSILCTLRGKGEYAKAATTNTIFSVATSLVLVYSVFQTASLFWLAVIILLCDILKFFVLMTVLNKSIVGGFMIRNIGSIITANKVITLIQTELRGQKHLLLTNIISSLMVRLPVIALGIYSTKVEVGIFSAGQRFYSALRIVPGAVQNVLMPAYSNESQYHTKKFALSTLSMIIGIGLIVAVILYISSDLLISYSFKFPQSIVVLQVLSIGFAGLFLKTVFESFLLAEHQERIVNVVLSIAFILTTILVFIPSFSSALGVAVIMSLGEWLCAVLFTMVYIRRRVHRN